MSKSSDDKSRRRPTVRKTTAGKIPAAKKGKKSTQPARIAGLLGVGLDNKDDHKRITTGEQFAIVGGSEETHDRMTETVVKTFEALKQRGKHLSQVERAELAEIIHKSTPR